MIEILSLYHPIPAAEQRLFKKSIQTSKEKKGAFLLFDGEIQTRLIMVKSGLACLYDDSGNKRKILDFAYYNRFCIDPISFFEQSPSHYCIECFSDCEIESIDYQQLQQLLDQSVSLEKGFRILLEKLYLTMFKRSNQFHTLSIEARFLQLMDNKPELFKLVPHKYIASYANIDPTNFSKLYNQYCLNNGLIYE
jgi:CRP-like cAMP-binding protein